jgi:hypothetical protein
VILLLVTLSQVAFAFDHLSRISKILAVAAAVISVIPGAQPIAAELAKTAALIGVGDQLIDIHINHNPDFPALPQPPPPNGAPPLPEPGIKPPPSFASATFPNLTGMLLSTGSTR